jgi:glycosyltransferase involved in cell wall biosynthesis
MNKIIFVIPGSVEARNKGFEKVIYDRIKSTSYDLSIEIIELSSIFKFKKSGNRSICIGDNSSEEKLVEIKKFNWNILDFFVAIKRLLSGHPLQSILYTNINFCKYLSRNKKHEIIVFVTSRGMQDKIPKYFILDYIDCLSLNFGRKHRSENSLFKKIIYFFEYRRLLNYEKELNFLSLKSFAVSEIDAKILGSKTISIPLSVKANDKNTDLKTRVDSSIVFSGNFKYEPNQQAVHWFVTNCLEKIHHIKPEVKLYLVGRGIDEMSRYKKYKQIVLVGEVSEMEIELAKYSVAIAPMQTGSGMQFKILEAMAANLPVLTTSLGLGGIQAKPGQEVVVADTAEDFVLKVVAILNDVALRRQIATLGYKYVSKHHDPIDLANRYFGEVLCLDK